MSTKHSAEKTTASIVDALSQHDLSDADKQKINEIICASMVNVVETTTEDHLSTTVRCCGPEADLAHQIRNEVNLKKKALIANLLGPR